MLCRRGLFLTLVLVSFVARVHSQTEALSFFPAGPDAVYSGGVKIAPGAPLYFTSGLTAGKDGGETMKAQALTTLKKLKSNIAAAGFGLNDVVFVRAYLAPGPDGAVDYAGWNAAWTETFGSSAVPHKPARTTIGVPALGSPTTLIEVEYVCAASSSDKRFDVPGAQTLPAVNPNLKVYGTKEARIAAGIGVSAGAAMFWSAGTTPGKDGGTDTKSQALTILKKLKTNLEAAGLSLGDIVFLRALLAPDPAKGGKVDSEGWNDAYAQFFTTSENPHKPARASIPVSPFGGEMLIEIEVIATYPGAPKPFENTPEAGALKSFGAADAMIASGIAVAEKSSFYFSAGAISTEEGDLKTQAVAALETLSRRLGEAGLSTKDVIFLRAYVVPEADGSFDRKGWGEAYNRYFNNPQNPHKPARTTIAVKSLPRQGAKIELDVIAASSK